MAERKRVARKRPDVTQPSALAQRDAVTDAAFRNGVKADLRARRLRAEVFGPGMQDAACTMLLDLFAATLDPRSVGVTELYRCSGVPATTALRVLSPAGRGGPSRATGGPGRQAAFICGAHPARL